jgi:hypothetical protein
MLSSEVLRDRQKGMSDYWSASPADGTLAAHCRPNENSALPFKRAAWDENTSLLVAEEVTRPIEQFGHIVARPNRRAAEQRDEVAARHSITSSARANTRHELSQSPS